VVDVPSWRNDIATPMLLDQQPDLPPARAQAAAEGAAVIDPEVDLIEEVLRLRGLDSVPAVSLPVDNAVPLPAFTPRQGRIASLRRQLAARGLLETVGFSFVAMDQAAEFGETPADLHLLNPIAADLDQMRPTPLVNLLAAVKGNAARGYPDLGLFEVGPAFGPDGQKLVAAGIRSGHSARLPGHPAQPVDLWQAKADALAGLAAAGAAMEGLGITTDAPSYYHPGRSGVIRQGPKLVLGHFGQLHPALLAARGIDVPVCAFTLYPDAVPEPKRKRKAPPALSAFQPLKRDFAFVVTDDIPAEKLLKAVKGAERNLIVAVSLFDVYEGDKIPAGHRSLGVEITLQPMDRTLTDAEIEAVCDRVLAAAQKSCNAVLRG